MTYTIKVFKEQQQKDNDVMGMGLNRLDRFENCIFEGGMTSDETIEIINHLHQLKEDKMARKIGGKE